MFVVGLVVMSIDGCLTRHDQPGTAFASNEDRAFFRDALLGFDCSVAGRKTYEAGRDSILRAREGSRLQVVLTTTPERFAGDARPEHLEFRNCGVADVARELAGRGRSRCAVLGGPPLYREARAQGLLNELWITVEPVAFGEGVRMFDGPVDFGFEFLSCEALSSRTLILKYRSAADDRRAGQSSRRFTLDAPASLGRSC